MGPCDPSARITRFQGIPSSVAILKRLELAGRTRYELEFVAVPARSTKGKRYLGSVSLYQGGGMDIGEVPAFLGQAVL